MGLRRLTSGEMTHTTATWVDPRHRHHQLLAAAPEVAVLLPHLTKAHKNLLSCQPSMPIQSATLAQKADELDAQHDDLVRGVHALFSALTFLSASPTDRQEWLALRDKLFPEGLSVVSRSYADEAGQAALAMARLTADDRKRMKSMTFGDGNLLALVDQYGLVARKLGDAATAKATPAAAVSSRADSAAARNQWIRLVSAILAAIEMTDASADIVREVVSPLRELLRRADRRRAPTDSTPAPSPAPSGAPTFPPSAPATPSSPAHSE